MAEKIQSLILGTCIIAGFAFHNMYKSPDHYTGSISVEGTAEQEVKADLVEWRFHISVVGDTLEETKEPYKKAKNEIMALFDKTGLVKEEDYCAYPKELSHSKRDDGKDVFTVTQSYMIKTQKINAAEQFFKSSEKLVEDGITLEHQGTLFYQIKDSKELEKLLCVKAIADANEKVRQLEKYTGTHVIGAPSIGWSYISFRDANASKDRYWDNGKRSDQIATLSVQLNYSVK
jgi:hypothetical protein